MFYSNLQTDTPMSETSPMKLPASIMGSSPAEPVVRNQLSWSKLVYKILTLAFKQICSSWSASVAATLLWLLQRLNTAVFRHEGLSRHVGTEAQR